MSASNLLLRLSPILTQCSPKLETLTIRYNDLTSGSDSIGSYAFIGIFATILQSYELSSLRKLVICGVVSASLSSFYRPVSAFQLRDRLLKLDHTLLGNTKRIKRFYLFDCVDILDDSDNLESAQFFEHFVSQMQLENLRIDGNRELDIEFNKNIVQPGMIKRLYIRDIDIFGIVFGDFFNSTPNFDRLTLDQVRLGQHHRWENVFKALERCIFKQIWLHALQYTEQDSSNDYDDLYDEDAWKHHQIHREPIPVLCSSFQADRDALKSLYEVLSETSSPFCNRGEEWFAVNKWHWDDICHCEVDNDDQDGE